MIIYQVNILQRNHLLQKLKGPQSVPVLIIIWGADVADTKLTSKHSKGFKYTVPLMPNMLGLFH